MLFNYSKVKLVFLTTLLVVILLFIFTINQFNSLNNNIVSYWVGSMIIVLCMNAYIIFRNFKNKNISYSLIVLLMIACFNFINNSIELNIFLNELNLLFLIVALYNSMFISYQLLCENRKCLDKLRKVTFYDPLTNLPNRNLLIRSCPIQKEIECSGNICKFCGINQIIEKNKKIAFYLIDIDDFKLVNDYLGHNYGDLLLKELAERIKSCVGNEDLVIHLSGDEFIVIIHNLDNKEMVSTIAKAIINHINQTFVLDNKSINIRCSIGITLNTEINDTIESIYKRLDLAMNNAKKEGKNKYCFFENELADYFNNRYELIEEIRNAIKQDEFIVHYQPKANIKDNSIIGLEALVRWNHKTKGIIYPSSFISIAEEIGIINAIDEKVLELACNQISSWTKACKKIYNIAVNVSPLFFMDTNFIPIIDYYISFYDIDPSYLSIEITESIALGNINITIHKLKELKKRNIKIYIDDFGKGYSSLSYIKNFPIDFLKIDKNFIDGIKVNVVDESIIKYIIGVTSLLDIKVISEGVERKEQLDFLKENNCFGYQGYLLSKPQPIENLNL